MSMLRGSEVGFFFFSILLIFYVDSGGERISEGFFGWGDNVG